MPRRQLKQWYHVDSNGRKIGYMWPEDMLIAIEMIWGRRKGIAAFAEYTNFSRTRIELYCNGTKPIPLHMALLVEALVKLVTKSYNAQYDYLPASLTRRTRKFPKIKADWLPVPPEREKTENVLDKRV